jgi:hypothetical protein
MNKIYALTLIPACMVSVMFYSGFSKMLIKHPEESVAMNTVGSSKFNSGELTDDCEWIAINQSSNACYTNPTLSFGPPDSVYLSVSKEQAYVSSSDALSSDFCSSIASLESTADGINKLGTEAGQIDVRWVCPISNSGVTL